MKRCPQCHRVETDETLKFCRNDGAVLVEDTAVSDQFSATKVLPSSPTSDAQVVPTDPGHAQVITAGLEPAKEPKGRFDAQPGLARTRSLVSVKHRKAIVLTIAGLIVVALPFALYFYRARNRNTAIDSIAVLPFVNTSAEPNTEFISDGITESIISSLSRLSHLKVMARSTVFQFKGKDVDPRKVGHDLGVRAVLMGRLIQQGDNLTIRTELVNVSDGTELWGQQYNRKVADVFAVQEEIAKEISEKLRLKLSGAERQQLAKRPTGEDLLMGLGYCEKAIEQDPNYALAYACLSDAYGGLGVRGYITPIEGRRKMEEAARKALALDENLGEAHGAIGSSYTYFAPYNFSLGDREHRRALELSPSLALAHYNLANSLIRQGRLDEGLEEGLKARELDPLSSTIARTVVLAYYCKRDYVRALELLRQANELGSPFSTTWEIGVYIQNRLFDEALAGLEKAKRDSKDNPLLLSDTGRVYASQGRRAEAIQIIKELQEASGASMNQAHWIAKIYTALNENEQAMSWLDRGLAAGAIGAFYKDDPVWDPIRSDPRFADLLRRMGIPS